MRRINDPHHARFLTFSTYRSLDLFGSVPLRDTFSNQLKQTRIRQPFVLYAWVLMPNHVHMLLREQQSGEVEGILRVSKQPLHERFSHDGGNWMHRYSIG
tara:strand:- start:58778 stop:59077 length:300 start_codon:yes stop_codon:yes gene_type:complete